MPSPPIGRAASAPRRATEKRKKKKTFQPGPPQWRPRTGPGQAPEAPGANPSGPMRPRSAAFDRVARKKKKKLIPPKKKNRCWLGPFFQGVFFFSFLFFSSAALPAPPIRAKGSPGGAAAPAPQPPAPNRRGGGAGPTAAAWARRTAGGPPPRSIKSVPQSLQGWGRRERSDLPAGACHPVLGVPGMPPSPAASVPRACASGAEQEGALAEASAALPSARATVAFPGRAGRGDRARGCGPRMAPHPGAAPRPPRRRGGAPIREGGIRTLPVPSPSPARSRINLVSRPAARAPPQSCSIESNKKRKKGPGGGTPAYEVSRHISMPIHR